MRPLSPHLTAFALSAFLACGGSSAPITTSPTDSGTPGTDGGSDSASTADGAVEVDGAVVTGPCTDCVAVAIGWGDTGGNVAFVLSSTLGSCRKYTRSRTGQGVVTCTTDLGVCGAPAIAIGDVEQAIAHPDVVGAFRAGQVPVYGSDSRPADGTVFHVDIGGKAFEVGGDCGPVGGSPCVAIPPGVSALVTLLRAVDKQEVAKPACAALR